ncbi:sugar phosphate isomerase/epimerase family protein [Sphingobacterium rhinopitheci]|uniref:sugar phosphate isomerase/epimerase family protein n=1 Tax=Sphingobacterium rhinopitheci TaxID=2781960 RepID=UPI001F52A35E|nr:sugar phosphate isomerase/epimerase family protein [Sphingobacterium rhinopitheci]MCI0920883.1 sugar phosphate isomerase/epimerase [Sphingobacterium rhinopitheci]
MDRKGFIKSSSLLFGSAIMSSSVSAIPLSMVSSNANKLKIGVSYYMIKEDLSLLDKLKLVKDLGFDGVEFNSPVDFSIDELLNAKNKSGIEIPSLVNKDHWSKPLSDPDSAVRNFTIASVAKSLQETKELGGDTVLVVPGVVNEKVSYQQAYNNALDSMRKLIPYVERTGIKIGIENVWNNFLISPVEAKAFLDAIDHPLIGWYFDIGNVLRYGWPEQWIEILGKHIFKLHAKEFSRAKMNDQGLWKGFDVELLEGDVDWKLVMQTLHNVGYNGGWLTSELGGGDRAYLKKVAIQMDKIVQLY